jgi:hypothetical protein
MFQIEVASGSQTARRGSCHVRTPTAPVADRQMRVGPVVLAMYGVMCRSWIVSLFAHLQKRCDVN